MATEEYFRHILGNLGRFTTFKSAATWDTERGIGLRLILRQSLLIQIEKHHTDIAGLTLESSQSFAEPKG
jgi:hypothetical protein